MYADLKDLTEILKDLEGAQMNITGLEYAFVSYSALQLQKKFRGVEFYLDENELERHCFNKMNEPLTVYVKLRERGGFYKIIR